jgi:hypothetical protein
MASSTGFHRLAERRLLSRRTIGALSRKNTE